MKYVFTAFLLVIVVFQSCLLPEQEKKKTETVFDPQFKLLPADTFYFKSFVITLSLSKFAGLADDFNFYITFPGTHTTAYATLSYCGSGYRHVEGRT